MAVDGELGEGIEFLRGEILHSKPADDCHLTPHYAVQRGIQRVAKDPGLISINFVQIIVLGQVRWWRWAAFQSWTFR